MWVKKSKPTHSTICMYAFDFSSLDTGIDLGQVIKAGPGKFGK